jgi:polyphosphate kinase 2 (PPK2 family)
MDVMGRLDQLDLSLKLSANEEAERLERASTRLVQLRLYLGGLLTGDAHGPGPLGPPLCVLFEGWDASGKGGAIKRLVMRLDPRHVRVVPYGAPNDDEKRHFFLKRFVPPLPGWGGMTILDRSWYGRVLVERVERLIDPPDWQRAYGEIVDFERMLAAEGMILVKFWMHISAEEQLRRFEKRSKDPLKSWKLTEEDWRNREKRPAYLEAVEEMFERTDHPAAPWQLVPGDSKRYARVFVVETVIAEIERGLRLRGLPVPAPLSRPSDR